MRGYLYFVDCFDCRHIITGDALRAAAVQAVNDAGMQEANRIYGFFPEHLHKTEHGESVLTLIIPLEQSHLCIHTWPAQRLVSIDLYTCGDRQDAKRAVNNLIALCEPKRQRFTGFKRGEW